jgi:hypothetical protein
MFPYNNCSCSFFSWRYGVSRWARILRALPVIKNLSEKFIHFRYKEPTGDLFRGTVIVPLPDPYKDHENFWIWFHPCFQTSQDVADLNDLYKYLDGYIWANLQLRSDCPGVRKAKSTLVN